jgi:hypothetical protein
VYDLIRAFSAPTSGTFHPGLLLGHLTHGHQIPKSRTAALALKPADVVLLSSGLARKSLQEVRGTDQGQKCSGKIDRKGRYGLVKIDKKGGYRFGLALLPLGTEHGCPFPHLSCLMAFVNCPGIRQDRLSTDLSGLTLGVVIILCPFEVSCLTHHMVGQILALMKDATLGRDPVVSDCVKM